MQVTKNKVHNDVVKNISKETGQKKEVVDAICRHLFSFIRSRISDFDDARSIRVPFLGVFTPIKTSDKYKMYTYGTTDINVVKNLQQKT